MVQHLLEHFVALSLAMALVEDGAILIFFLEVQIHEKIRFPHPGSSVFQTDCRPHTQVEYFALRSERRYPTVINFYSIKSKSSGLYDTPFPCESDARAVYELRYLINSVKDSAISADPSDHSLIRVATFDNESGKVKAQNDCIIKDLSSLKKKGGD